MTLQTDKTGQIQTRKDDSLSGLVTRMAPQMARAMPSHLNADKLARIALTALRTTPKLEQCTPASFMACVMQCSVLGLEMNTPLGLAYLIPRKQECTMIIGYQGMIELAMRSGRVSSIFAHAVHDGDDFNYKLGLNPDIHHVPSDAPERDCWPITHVYAVARIKDAEPIFTVLSKAQVDARRLRSPSAKSSYSPWQTDFEAMALKSAVRALFKWMPKSTELARVEAIEMGADMGNQMQALDINVSEGLENAGLLPDETDVIDEATGEVLDREPGADDAGLGE